MVVHRTPGKNGFNSPNLAEELGQYRHRTQRIRQCAQSLLLLVPLQPETQSQIYQDKGGGKRQAKPTVAAESETVAKKSALGMQPADLVRELELTRANLTIAVRGHQRIDEEAIGTVYSLQRQLAQARETIAMLADDRAHLMSELSAASSSPDQSCAPVNNGAATILEPTVEASSEAGCIPQLTPVRLRYGSRIDWHADPSVQDVLSELSVRQAEEAGRAATAVTSAVATLKSAKPGDGASMYRVKRDVCIHAATALEVRRRHDREMQQVCRLLLEVGHPVAPNLGHAAEWAKVATSIDFLPEVLRSTALKQIGPLLSRGMFDTAREELCLLEAKYLLKMATDIGRADRFAIREIVSTISTVQDMGHSAAETPNVAVLQKAKDEHLVAIQDAMGYLVAVADDSSPTEFINYAQL